MHPGPGRGASVARRARRRSSRAALDRDACPLLGVCLGAQLIARAAGAPDRPGRDGPRSAGSRSSSTTPGAHDPVLGVLPAAVDAFQWHYYTFELPAGATLLADERRRAPGLPPRRPHVGRSSSTPRSTRHMLESWFVEGARRAAASRSTSCGPRPTGCSAPWNAHGRALCSAFLDARRGAAVGRVATRRVGRRAASGRSTTRATSPT